jgi:hypothetical protein
MFDAKFTLCMRRRGLMWNFEMNWKFDCLSSEVVKFIGLNACVVLCVKISRAQKVSAGADSRDARGKLNKRRRVRYVSGPLD